MTIYDIKNSINSEAWSILPERLEGLKHRLETPNRKAPISSQEALYEAEASIAIVPIHGDLVKAGGLSDEDCAACGVVDYDNLYSELSFLGEQGFSYVILDIDSGGGMNRGLFELGQLIQNLGNAANIIAYTSGVCASAAYFIAAQCNEFFCSPSSTIGSIGTAFPRLDTSAALDKEGVEIAFIASDPKKFWGCPQFPLTEEEIAWREAEVERLTNEFKSGILQNRTISPEYLNSSVYDGLAAVRHNFADGTFNSLGDLLRALTQ